MQIIHLHLFLLYLLFCRRPPAAWVTEHLRLSVGESTVQRILKREGLVRPPEIQLAAGKEYQRKTTGPHQMWAAGAAYFRVVAAW